MKTVRTPLEEDEKYHGVACEECNKDEIDCKCDILNRTKPDLVVIMQIPELREMNNDLIKELSNP